MVRFTSGPDLPLSVIKAREEDALVIFAGAGVSKFAGLPLFRGLVQEVYGRLGDEPGPLEQQELNNEAYDRVLTLLEKRYGAKSIREAVRLSLAEPGNPDLSVHRALLQLSTSTSGVLRLVTTNFDTLFRAASPEAPWCAAPLLPVPKAHKLQEIVYLHGWLGNGRDPLGTDLVLTSADFGLAYLTEQWASRFLTGLFQNFSVLFVGYGLNDPVMKYLVDALAADRRMGQTVRDTYALVGSLPERKESTEAEWRASGVIPIVYDKRNGHSELKEVVLEWAKIWRDGLLSKESIVSSTAFFAPASLTEYEKSRLVWALEEPSGVPARRLINERAQPVGEEGEAAIQAVAPLQWLDEFQSRGLLGRAVTPVEGSAMPLVQPAFAAPAAMPLSPLGYALCAWLSHHLSDPDLLRWAIASGSHLHPGLEAVLRRGLTDLVPIADGLRQAWEFLLSSQVDLVDEGIVRRLDLLARCRKTAWSDQLKRDVLSALQPSPSFHPRVFRMARDSAGQVRGSDSGSSLTDYLGVDLYTRGGRAARLLLDALESREDWSVSLGGMASELSSLLANAVQLNRAAGLAGPDWDLSHIQRPSISPHSQNRSANDWTLLIELARASVLALSARDRERGLAILNVWKQRRSPLHRRMVLDCAVSQQLLDPKDVLDLILSAPDHWLWPVTVERELFIALRCIWSSLTEEDRERLSAAIAEGPPRDLFVAGLSEADWAETEKRFVWERLVRLNVAGPALQGHSSDVLESIQESYPQWQFGDTEREDFPTWSESIASRPSDYTTAELLGLDAEEAENILVHHARDRQGLMYAFRQGVEQRPAWGLDRLRSLASRELFVTDVWRSGLQGLRDADMTEDESTTLLDLVDRNRAALLPELSNEVTDIVKQLSKTAPHESAPQVLSLWDEALDSLVRTEREADRNG